MTRIDFYQLTAEQVHRVPEGWKWCVLDMHNKPDDFIEVKGAVPVGVYRSGKRKGQVKFPKESELKTIWMRKSEIMQVRENWEQENGKCHNCEGSGKQLAGCGITTGPRFRPCVRCEGTGKPPG